MENKINPLIDYVANTVINKISANAAQIAILEASSLVQTLMFEHQQISHQILRSLESAMSGKINHLITVNTLIKDLYFIHRTLPHSQMLPIDFSSENPLRIFEYTKTDASLFGQRLLLRITLPILERQQYSIYEFIPIPTFLENKAIIINPSNRYMVMSDTEYIPISAHELENNKYTINNERIISPSENSYLNIYQNCELNIFRAPKEKTITDLCDIKLIPNMNYFISINHHDLFYVAIKNPITVTEYCDGKTMKTYEINKSGKLILEKGCKVTTESISIRPRSNYRLYSNEQLIISNHSRNITLRAFTKKIEFAKNISIPGFDKDIIIKDFTGDFQKLAQESEKLYEQSFWETKINEIHYDNVNRSYFIYWVIGIVIVAIIIAISILCLYIYLKFYNVNTWIKLADVLGTRNLNEVPKLFIQNNDAPSNQWYPFAIPIPFIFSFSI